MKPGIYNHITNAEYHKGAGLGSSDLKQLLRSPAHYLAAKLTPTEPTPEMLRGSLIHTLILEPDKFDAEYVVGEFKIRRGKEYDKLVADNAGKVAISCDELADAQAVVTAFHAQCLDNPELMKLFTGGIRENSVYWEDKDTGILCKARPDIITSDSVIVDLKTARDASFDAFQRAVVDYQYHVSAAHYLDGVGEIHGKYPTEFILVVIETKEPYPVAIYRLAQKAIDFGEAQVKKALERYSLAVTENVWAGYPKEIVEMDIPNWAFYRSNSPTR